MTRTQKFNGGDRNKKLHQFLSDVCLKALRQHLGQLLGAAQLSDDRKAYERNIKRMFGDQHEMKLIPATASSE